MLFFGLRNLLFINDHLRCGLFKLPPLSGAPQREPRFASHSASCCLDRKSTRLNSSHRCISYAVFCLKKKTDGKVGHALSETMITVNVAQMLLDVAGVSRERL